MEGRSVESDGATSSRTGRSWRSVGRRRGKGMGRGGSNSRDTDNGTNVQLSKKLSSLLRHRAEANGLHVRPDGYVLLEDVLKTSGFQGVNMEQIRQVGF